MTEDSKRHLHKALGIVFVILVLTAIVAGIYYWQITKEIPSFVQAPVHQDAKTYTNQQFGFEFQYPKNWQLVKIPDGEQIIAGNISIYPEAFKSKLDAYVNTMKKSADILEDQNIQANGVEWRIIKFKDKPSGLEFYKVVHEENGNVVSFTSSVEAHALEYLKLILSTFQFNGTQIGVNSFASCAAAGYPIMESFPEQCKAPDGTTFVKPTGVCIQVVAYARNIKTGEVREFPTPCDIPIGWMESESNGFSQ